MCANAVDRPLGSVIYTQLLNARGGIEADVTLVRLASDRYLYVTGTAFGSHNLAWLRQHLPEDGSVYVDDITSSRTCYCLWGPRARDILQPLTKSRPLERGVPVHARAGDRRRRRAAARLARDLRRRARLGALRARRVRARRSTTCSTQAGAAHGLRGGGYRAIESMRLEKGYRAWGTRPHAGDDARVGGRRLRGAARQAGAVHRPGRAARRARGGRARASASPASCSTTRARSASARSPCASPASCAVASPRAATAAACGAASRSPTCPRRTPRPARAPRSRCSASGCRRRSSEGALYDPGGERIRARRSALLVDYHLHLAPDGVALGAAELVGRPRRRCTPRARASAASTTSA